VSKNRPHSPPSKFSQRRKKKTRFKHVSFKLYDEDADRAEEIVDWTPMVDLCTQIFRLVYGPLRKFHTQTLAEALNIRVPDSKTEIATFPVDSRVYQAFIQASQDIGEATGREPGPEALMAFVVAHCKPHELKTAFVAAQPQTKVEKPKKPSKLVKPTSKGKRPQG